MEISWGNRDGEISNNGYSLNFSTRTDPKISVLLPTYRRPDALKITLKALECQSAIDYEVVVVDDGSHDGTEAVLENFASTTDLNFSYLVLKKNGGPARARNFGLSRCRGDVVLIIGDDIETAQDFVDIHCQSHQQNPVKTHAVLGHVCFPEELSPTEFMKWLEKGGRKYFFNYQDLTPGKESGPLFFYTCNVSVKKVLLDECGWFDESFPFASHEDLELGYRLANKGMRMIYLPEAAGYHHHLLTIEGITRRIYLMGFSAALYWKKVDDRGGPIRQILRSVIARAVSLPPGVALWKTLRNKQFNQEQQYPLLWHILLSLSFFIGLSDSRHGKSPRV